MKHRIFNLALSLGMTVGLMLGGSVLPAAATANSFQLKSARGKIQHVIYV